MSLNPTSDIFILQEHKEINNYPSVVKLISLLQATRFSNRAKRDTGFHVETFNENDASFSKGDKSQFQHLETETEKLLNLIPPIGKCLDEEYIKYFKTLMAYEHEGMFPHYLRRIRGV
jgi:ERCC4-type nuclease